jgi:hypothetical protein
MSYNLSGSVMVGGVIPWLKTFTNTPALPPAYVECNGQTLNDPQSVFHNQLIPNLNGSGGTTKRFLQGITSSGATAGADSHTHTASNTYGWDLVRVCMGYNPSFHLTNQSNLPYYYEVVFIMRIK